MVFTFLFPKETHLMRLAACGLISVQRPAVKLIFKAFERVVSSGQALSMEALKVRPDVAQRRARVVFRAG